MLIDFDIFTVVLLFVIYIISILILKYKFNKSAAYLIIYTFLFIYLSEVLKYTQFPIMVRTDLQEKINQNILASINFVPLVHLVKDDIQTSILNFVMAVPFGVLVPMLKKVKFRKLLLYAVLFGLVIEAFQLIVALAVGFTFRVIDVNDIIFNGLGVVSGYFVYKILIFILRKLNNSINMPMNFMVEHLLQNESHIKDGARK